MVAEHVELALFEQSLGNIEGLNRPFCDRVADAAEKTEGSVLFDVRVDGDTWVQRIAAIGYGVIGTAIIVMGKNGQLRCASVDGDTALLVSELAAWNASPLGEQAKIDQRGAANILLATLRSSGHFGSGGWRS
ncbi:hypothetical protein FJ959_30550 [Mesorhizobium sp. B2-2-4]|nr:hypothetical protein FJW11_29385 [Mesorhizobium sp. B3-1-1]TPJ39143.1 hypothetical protein FJ437_29085 [Mesorhizobium sp. B2-6-6]TPJ68388.1 hypothetical protein FJ462_14505 [Mesorhizobium sp. B2-6-7]TPJ77010.1 hypothetical protein FJ422_29275 [Mesorhizobium sp. B2-6-3]TPJ91447.1 hypothetical protein FJ491_30435 [Mesorhizobium sp. B2-5-10]TPK10016.1 hypothetical protein FJ490_16565 [Mesorhizobium sp. B2-5-11]TPK22939.1 hypothetical protein FJ885_30720 [Mesorhizobium sp. B2-5-8]TPK49257.1 h